jgi:hypothetical protein
VEKRIRPHNENVHIETIKKCGYTLLTVAFTSEISQKYLRYSSTEPSK